MKSSASPVLVVVAVALIAAALAPAAIQQGSGKLELQPGLTGSVKAKCKQPNRKGKAKASLVGCGFRGTGFSVINHGMVPKGKSVKGTAINDAMTPAKATIRAYCARDVETTIRSVTDKFTPLATHNFFAKCGKGELALSGGWHTVGAPPAFWTVQNSLRQGPRTWLISAAASDSGRLAAFVVCTKSPVDLVTRSGPKVKTIAGQVADSTAKCPAGTEALGGGFSTSVDEGTAFDSTVAPVASLRKGKRDWTARGVAEQTRPGQYIRAKVICSGSL